MTEQPTKKYEFVESDTIEYRGRYLKRIRAIRNFGEVKKGDLGGYIEKEENLSHEGNCWVGEEAKVFENACVFENAKVGGRAEIFGGANVCGHSSVFRGAYIGEDSWIQ